MRLSSSLMLVVLVASSAAAGDGAPVMPDRSRGEEEQILARERWFGDRRGLAAIPRADLLRRAAVAEARALRAQSSERVEGLAWQPLGPDSMTMLGWTMGLVAGRVSALAVDPDHEQVLYLGAASGGLWKSTDGGGSWASLFDDVGTETIGSIALDPADPNTVWVGTGEQGQSCWDYFGLGLYRSTDGGLTWEARNGSGGTALSVSYVSSIVVHPTVPGLVLAGGHGFCSGGGYYYGGLFRSTDSGSTWLRVMSGAVTDVVVDPVDPSVMLAGRGRWGQTGDGVYRSTDAGLTWQRLTNGLPVDGAVGRIRLAQARTDAAVLYALIEDYGGSGGVLYRSTDGGDSWQNRNASACEGQCWYDLCLSVHPSDPQTLLVGSIRFARSTDGGTTLVPLIAGWGSGQKVHQDIHVLAYSATDPNRFWVGGDGGLWRTDDGGTTFANLNGNLNITQLYDLAVHPFDPGTVFSGAQDNSSQRRAGDQRWDVTEVTGDGFMNVVDPANPNLVFQTSYPSGGQPNLCKSTTGGAPGSFSWLWNQGLTPDEPYPWVTPLVAAALDTTDTPLFLASNHVYRSATTQPWYAFQWTEISPDLTGSDTSAVSVLTPVVTGGTVALYAGTDNGRVWWCADTLAPSPVWVEVTGNYPGGYVSDLAADPAAPEKVYLTRGNFGASRLYRSTSGGTFWVAAGAGIPDAPANAVALDPSDSSRVFVGSDVGVFESLDGGATFSALMTGLPLGVVVTDLEVAGDPPRLTAGTYGRGAWQLQLDQPAMFSDGFESGDTSAWSGVVP